MTTNLNLPALIVMNVALDVLRRIEPWEVNNFLDALNDAVARYGGPADIVMDPETVTDLANALADAAEPFGVSWESITHPLSRMLSAYRNGPEALAS